MSNADASRLRCWNCGTTLDGIPLPLSRHEHCPQCFEALHCCRLCRHYRPNASITCDEDRADPPTNKENANFCDFFRPRRNAYGAERGERSRDAKARLDALFGGDSGEDAESAPTHPGPEPSPAESARARLDALFGDDSDGDQDQNG